MKVRTEPTSSALKVNSPGLSLITASELVPLNCGFAPGSTWCLGASRPHSLLHDCPLSMNFLRPSIIPLRLFSLRPVTILSIGLPHLSVAGAFARSSGYHTALAMLHALERLLLHEDQHRPVSPVACWEPSNRTGRHMPHTTNSTDSSSCCCRRRAPMTPTICNPQAEDSYSAGRRTTRSHLRLQ